MEPPELVTLLPDDGSEDEVEVISRNQQLVKRLIINAIVVVGLEIAAAIAVGKLKKTINELYPEDLL